VLGNTKAVSERLPAYIIVCKVSLKVSIKYTLYS